MPQRRLGTWAGVLVATLLLACGGTPYEPTAARLVGEFSGEAGTGFETYDLFLAVDQVSDSVRGVWSLSFPASCGTHDGPFSGVLEGDRLRLRLRPDEPNEAELDLVLRVLPGDSVLTGVPRQVERTDGAPAVHAFCGTDSPAALTLHAGEVDWFPIDR